MDMKQSFSTSEVAKYCHVTPDTIRKWAEAGRIQVFKTPGGHRRIRREDLLRFLRENSIPVHPDLCDGAVKVLIAEPDRPSASVISRFLERTHSTFQVEAAIDGFDVGVMLATFQPDVIFLNINLPGADGLEVCRRIKSIPEYSGVNIIAMANSDDTTIAARALESGASGCLRKPFTPDDLRRTLARVGVEVA